MYVSVWGKDVVFKNYLGKNGQRLRNNAQHYFVPCIKIIKEAKIKYEKVTALVK